MTAERMGAFLMGAGLLFLAGAAGILGTNLHTEEQAADHTRQVRTTFVEEILPETPLPQDTATEIQKVEIQGEEYIGLLEIPSLELSLPVGEELTDQALRLSVCRYSGSYLDDDMIIGGHNYRCHFGPLSRIKAGDSLYFTDIGGVRYEYQVAGVEQIPGNEAQRLPWDQPGLTLFTCDYTGNERLVVRCLRIYGAE